ncbi:SubName: Full=Related to phosphoserine aminotransferase {ECO:0000313/EMBL:CCA66689.1} [Serendipita indica DSM 11827]|nr:SubName: Full=Related to phosphoserine aminotransferase {ECO:0000313/EMBL:CCA66689.1} [Serendipita indica DSM 11827]
MERKDVLNLGAGPSALPEHVLQEAARGLLNYNGTGMGITEISHRSKEFQQLTNDLSATLRSLLNVPQTHEILFAQGGASLVFSSIVLNLLSRFKLLHPEIPASETYIDYVVTGTWSKKASEEGKRLAGSVGVNVNIAADSRAYSKDGKSFECVPPLDAYKWSPPAQTAFVYYCENETVNGVQFASSQAVSTAFPLNQFQDNIDPPIIADFSSSFLSRPIPNISSYGMIYGGAQKNVGPAGLTILIVRKDLLVDVDAAHKLGAPVVPLTLSYKTLADNGSLYNTPPMFSMYVSLLVAKDIAAKGGLVPLEERNYQKQETIYGALEKLQEKGLIRINVLPGSRSWMNVTFVFLQPDKEKAFLEATEAKGLRGVKGHRSVGGFRISLYNAITQENADTVATVLTNFLNSST